MAIALPVLFASGMPQVLERIPLGAMTGGYTEKWLQDLIQSCPAILPTGEIEPGFGQLIPVSTEVNCGHGYIDNLFVTGEGGIAIVETKLWRNPEARREVVAQALDYASALSQMRYADFESAALGGQFPAGQTRPASLHALVAERADALDEAAFAEVLTG